jgi:hypothetical protein
MHARVSRAWLIQDPGLPSGNTCPAEFIRHLQKMVDNSFQIDLGFRPKREGVHG